MWPASGIPTDELDADTEVLARQFRGESLCANREENPGI
jgi:hypothetical protein